MTLARSNNDGIRLLGSTGVSPLPRVCGTVGEPPSVPVVRRPRSRAVLVARTFALHQGPGVDLRWLPSRRMGIRAPSTSATGFADRDRLELTSSSQEPDSLGR